jgi:subtilisin-like proprotein convertase family protein
MACVPGVVATETATAITSATASLNGTVRPGANPVTAWFEWGTTGFTSTSAVFQVSAGSAAVPVSTPLTGLQPHTTYQYRLVGRSGTNYHTGSPITFTTLRQGFVDYYAIGYAGVNGIITHPQTTIDPPGGTAYQTALTPSFPTTQGGWTFATDAPPTGRRGQFQRTPGLTSDGPATRFSLTVLGTTYNPGGGLVAFTIASPETVGATDHIGYGKTTPGYGYRFYWNLIAKPGTTAWWVDAAGTHFFDLSNATGSEFFADSPGVAGNLYGFYIQGSELNTLQIAGWEFFVPGVVTTETATAITSTTASLNGTVRPGANPVPAWFEWGTTGFTSTSAVFQVSTGSVAVPVSAPLTGLQPDTTYQYRLVGRSGTNYHTSNPVQFTTLLSTISNMPLGFVDYYSIGYAGVNGTITHPQSVIDPPGGTPYSTALTPMIFDHGVWTFSTTAFSGVPRGQFQRHPGLTHEGPAESFTLSAIGAVASLTISSPPTNTPPPNGYGSGPCWPSYQFLWSVDLEPGSKVWMVDARGYRLLADTPGYHSQYATFYGQSTVGAAYGFYLQSSSNRTDMHVRGLIPVTPRLDPVSSTQITTTAAALYATVIAYGWPVAVWFEWGEGALTNRTTLTSVDCATSSGPLVRTLTGLRPGTTYQFRLMATNESQSFSSQINSFTTLKAPAITTQPQSRTNAAGTTATFSVTASGVPAPTYQWRRNNTNVTDGGRVFGATTATLTVSNVAISDATSYTVVVTNVAGAVTSAPPAFLTVATLLSIIGQPQSRTNIAGTTATFTVTATGSAPLGYQWRRNNTNLTNGGNISGTTNATLTLSNVTASDVAGYTVVVTNGAGAATSAPPATLTVWVPPVISGVNMQPSGPVIAGTNLSLCVAATGTGPLSYRWRRNGINLVDGGRTWGASASCLTITNVQAADSGNYVVVVTNVAASVTSAPPTVLSVLFLPVIIGPPQSRTNTAGTTATFTVTATGSSPLGYQWRRNNTNLTNGGNISGTTAATLTVSNVTASDATSYTVVVTNSAGVVTSAPPAWLTVLTRPVITSQPQSRTNIAGTTATFTVTATGSTPLSYQWRRNNNTVTNGGNISGTTTATLTVSNVTASDATSYTVVVTNSAGAVTSAPPAWLTVLTRPVITGQPQSRTNLAGTTAAFSVTATGNPAPSYQWWFNGTTLAGATIPSLTLTNVQMPQAGNYIVVVSNAVGAVTSTVATLVVPGIEASKPNTIVINDHASGSPYPSTITVTGQAGVVRQAIVTLRGLTHAWPGDVGVLLVGPQGQRVVLMANAGGGSAVNNVMLTFDDNAATSLTTNGPITSSTNRPSSLAGGDVFPAPAPPGPYGTNLSVLTRTNPNGVWSLYVHDDAGGDSGKLSQGWTLSLWLDQPPTITTQPLSQTVIAGNSVSFTVAATGSAPLAYAWQRSGTNLAGERFIGTNTPTLTITNVQTNDAGTNYSVRVTNGAGATNSLKAELRVLPSWTPVLGCLRRLTNGSFQFCVCGAEGSNYVVEASSDLEHWKMFLTVTITNRCVDVLDNSVGLGQRLYRARIP